MGWDVPHGNLEIQSICNLFSKSGWRVLRNEERVLTGKGKIYIPPKCPCLHLHNLWIHWFTRQREIKVADRIWVVNQLILNREVILGYSGGPSGITMVLKSRRGRQGRRVRERCDDGSRIRGMLVDGFEDGRKGHESLNVGGFWKLEKEVNEFFAKLSEGMHLEFSPVRPMSNVWPIEL